MAGILARQSESCKARRLGNDRVTLRSRMLVSATAERSYAMRGLRFWKRESTTDTDAVDPPFTSKFGIQPRHDLRVPNLPNDPDIAARAAALQKRRDSLVKELRTAEEAGEPGNQWRRQIGLINEALEAIERERSALVDEHIVAGEQLPPLPIADIAVELELAPTVRFRVGDVSFVYEE